MQTRHNMNLEQSAMSYGSLCDPITDKLGWRFGKRDEARNLSGQEMGVELAIWAKYVKLILMRACMNITLAGLLAGVNSGETDFLTRFHLYHFFVNWT